MILAILKKLKKLGKFNYFFTNNIIDTMKTRGVK